MKWKASRPREIKPETPSSTLSFLQSGNSKFRFIDNIYFVLASLIRDHFRVVILLFSYALYGSKYLHRCSLLDCIGTPVQISDTFPQKDYWRQAMS